MDGQALTPQDRHLQICQKLKEVFERPRQSITFWEGDQRVTKPMHELIAHAFALSHRLVKENVKSVALMGPSCPKWLAIDLACLVGGIKLLAIPDTLSLDRQIELISQYEGCAIWAHHNLKLGKLQRHPLLVQWSDDWPNPIELQLKEPPSKVTLDGICSIAFTSGTQGDGKTLEIPYPDLNISQEKLTPRFVSKNPSGRRSIFIWMSFTHYLQRWLALQAIAFDHDLILAPTNRAIHALEGSGATMMVSAPILFQALALKIRKRVQNSPPWLKASVGVYVGLRIYRLKPHNFLRRFVDRVVLARVVQVWGGTSAPYFVWSGGPIDSGTLQYLENIGLRIYGGYALSELGPISSDRPETYRRGSCGIPSRSVSIDMEKQILILRDDKVRDARNLQLKNGFIHTGDMGYLDNDGYLFVHGRLDNIVILSNGHNIRPEVIQQYFQKELNCGCVVTSYDRRRLTLIVIAENPSISKQSLRDVALNWNSEAVFSQRIHGLRILQTSPDKALIGPSAKVRRVAVIEAAEQVEEWPIMV